MKIKNFFELRGVCLDYKSGLMKKEELKNNLSKLEIIHNLKLVELDVLTTMVDIEYKRASMEGIEYEMDYYLYSEIYTMFYYFTAKTCMLIDSVDINMENYDLFSECGVFDYIINENKNQYDLFIKLLKNKQEVNVIYMLSEVFDELSSKKSLDKEMKKMAKIYKEENISEIMDKLNGVE